MKLLMLDTDEFWYRASGQTPEHAAADDGETEVKDALVILVSVEKEDEEDPGRAAKKAADNVAWLARKTGRGRIVLQSFAHLSDSNAAPEAAATARRKYQILLRSIILQ
jgi:hypothetical protein